MSKRKEAVVLAKAWAADPAHGYDQGSRNGPDYDCSSLLNNLWEAVGVPVMRNGATYTGNMKRAYLASGFVVADVDRYDLSIGAQLDPGDVLLNEEKHCAIYVGNGQIVQASINELGTVTGGQTGDQTGREIEVRRYYDYPWNCVLRLAHDKDAGSKPGSAKEEAKGGTYTVKPGESWWGIAQKCWGDGSLMYELAKLNGKSVNSVIHPGDVLQLSGNSATDERKKQLERDVAALGGRIIWE